jgi:hypothetical protein
MPQLSRLPRRWRVAALAAMGTGAVVAAALASDHQDTAEVELNPKQDMTDVYAFPGSQPGRIVLVMNTRAFLTPAQTPGATFDPNLLYQFKIDNDGDAKEDRVIQVTFSGDGSAQKVQVRGPVAPPVQGPTGNRVADAAPAVSGALNTTLGSASGIEAFAGARDDSFFIDLEAAFCILPDRKPTQGPLSGACALPANPSAPFYFRPAGQAVNYVSGFNVMAIVIELPSSLLENGTPGKLGIWGTISR